MPPTSLLCPSSTCEEGHLLLGVVQAHGQVAFLPEPLPVDREFVQVARAGRSPGKRFRFASACRCGGCQQWQNGQCSVIERALQSDLLPLLPLAEALAEPPCTIRDHCHWYAQRGTLACQGCTFIVTDTLEATESPPTAAS